MRCAPTAWWSSRARTSRDPNKSRTAASGSGGAAAQFEGRTRTAAPGDSKGYELLANGTWKGPGSKFGAYWHQDGQFWRPPLHNVLSVLHCQSVPPAGGETGFADLRAALATLSGPLRERADQCVKFRGASLNHDLHAIDATRPPDSLVEHRRGEREHRRVGAGYC